MVAHSVNDYYPFLVQKISELEGDGESRRKALEIAREELVTNLARPALRVPASEIAGESRAFDAAIRRIEAETARETRAPTTTSGIVPQEEQRAGKRQPEREMPQANSIDRSIRAEDIRVLPRGAAHDFDLNLDRRMPGVAAARDKRRRVIGVMLAIVACGLVFVVIYFSTSIEKWLGI
jgi:hypothetical protein